MTEREMILSGNSQVLDALYKRLADTEHTSQKRYQFILKQQHEINELKRLSSAAPELLEALLAIQEASLIDYQSGIQSSQMCSAVAKGICAIAKARGENL